MNIQKEGKKEGRKKIIFMPSMANEKSNPSFYYVHRHENKQV